MKILIVYPVDFKKNLNRGIFDKMIGQGEAMEKLGHVVSYAYLEGAVGKIFTKNQEQVITSAISNLFAKYHSFFSGLKKYNSINRYDICYIRHLLHTHSLFSFVEVVKSIGIRVIYEYPTLPYEREWMKPIQRLALLEDAYFRRKVESHFDKVVHYGGYDRNLNSIQITNGIQFRTDVSIPKYTSGAFRMIAIGRWEYWHGLDRLIQGIPSCNQDVELHIVGQGPYLGVYRALVTNLSLNDKVLFHSSLFGAHLEELISKCHLGIGTLGLHRKEVVLDSSLKHRMYCSYGVPFLYAGKDSDFMDDLEFVFTINGDDGIININGLIEDYLTRNIHPVEIRKYAHKHLSWYSRMRVILEKP